MTLPDIAKTSSQFNQPLKWVGMENITLPIFILGQPVVSHVDVGVSLDQAEARGIHMSRLYTRLDTLARQELNLKTLKALLQQFLDSHEGLSNTANITLQGELPLQRPALLSALSGWKSYPFELQSQLSPSGFELTLKLTIGYSSTCPCSAALARQLIQQAFAEKFDTTALSHAEVYRWLGTEEGIMATPHSQRSEARIELKFAQIPRVIPWLELINNLEKALSTPLQTAVKRADEQEFARLNGAQPMFCEDAARHLHACLARREDLRAFAIKVIHAESLHAHDAVACSRWERPQAPS